MSGHELIMMWIMEELHTHATWAMRMSELCLRQATAARTAEARSASARARASGRMVVGEGRFGSTVVWWDGLYRSVRNLRVQESEDNCFSSATRFLLLPVVE